MKRAMCVALATVLAACHHVPPQKPVAGMDRQRADTEPVVPDEDSAPPTTIEVPAAQALADAPPCLPLDPNARISPRPRRTVARTPPPPAPEPAPTPAQPVSEPSVKPVANLSMSILGKKVHGAQDEDLGRVVDVIADVSGRVRVAIIEFGGFLGVGLKRVAVDWSLLKFQPSSPDSPWLLEVPPQQLQAAPEYKDGRAFAIMAPSSGPEIAPPMGAAPAIEPKK